MATYPGQDIDYFCFPWLFTDNPTDDDFDDEPDFDDDDEPLPDFDLDDDYNEGND